MGLSQQSAKEKVSPIRAPRPLHDNIIIVEDAPEEQSQGGVLLPQLRRVSKREGTVVAVGPGRILPDYTRAPVGVKPGERVIYDSLSGTVINFRGQSWVTISDKSVLAVMPSESN